MIELGSPPLPQTLQRGAAVMDQEPENHAENDQCDDPPEDPPRNPFPSVVPNEGADFPSQVARGDTAFRSFAVFSAERREDSFRGSAAFLAGPAEKCLHESVDHKH